MCDFERLYFQLFAATADATEALEQGDYDRARQILTSARQNAEEQYIRAE